MVKRAILLVAVLAVGAVYAAFGRASSSPIPQEISSADALKARDAFIRGAGLKPDPAKPRVSMTTLPSGWLVQDPSHYLRIDGAGNVTMFRNDRGRGVRTGKKRFSSRADAEAHVRKLAAALKVPSSWKLKRLEMTNARGEIVAGFAEPLPGGHNVLEGPVPGEPIGINGAMMFLDVQDGTLRSWTFRTGAVVDTPNLRIQRADAIRRAQQAYSSYYSKRRSFHGGPMDPARVKLGYTWVQGAIDHVGAHARLYWSVPFGDEPVLVDAETGDSVVMALK